MNRSILIATAALVLAAFGEGDVRAAKGDAPRIVPAEKIKWVEDKRLPGVKSFVLWGDPTGVGEHAMLRKFPAGYAPPRHSHPSTESLVMIAGHIIVEHEGGDKLVLGPGSYSEIPANMIHAVRCTSEEDCIFVLRSPGSFTINLAPDPRRP